MFFVLSGYLITGILLRSRAKPNNLRNFYIRRALRIAPLYYLLVIFCLKIAPHVPVQQLSSLGNVSSSHWYYWLFLSNVPLALSGSWGNVALDITWSLSVEEQFYLLWPAIVLFAPITWIRRIGLLGAASA